MSTRVLTGKCRASYVHLFEPHISIGSEPKYSVSLIIPKSDTETIANIRAAIEEAKQNSVSKWGGKIPDNLKLPLRDGDEERKKDPAYKNSYFLNTSTTVRPQLVDARKQNITDPTVIYSGCYVRATVNFYAFNTNGNRGIAAGLGNVQFWCDGEPLNGRTRAEDDFTDLEAEDEDDFLS